VLEGERRSEEVEEKEEVEEGIRRGKRGRSVSFLPQAAGARAQ